MEKQTAGHKALGDFAPQFAHLNDDVLFGEVWAKESELSLKLRSIITVSTLIGEGITTDALKYHLMSAKKNGVTKEEMAALARDAEALAIKAEEEKWLGIVSTCNYGAFVRGVVASLLVVADNAGDPRYEIEGAEEQIGRAHV